MAEDQSSRPHRPMDIDDESLAIRDGEADFDPTRDATVRVTSLFFNFQQLFLESTLFLKKKTTNNN